ncbi:unnamed protein product [Rotaria socialis]|uniref:Uncharacterized protein n=2 Tax=Rotaria socialis TaxID=392032 RepID=A0A821D591_9BILA|nr:unnamed protein product [Rotaria socialis]
MDVDEQNACFFKDSVPQISCNDNQIGFSSLLQHSDEPHTECRSQLEQLLLLADYYDIQRSNIYHHAVCSNHRVFLLDMSRRKSNCQLCVDIFNRKRCSISSLHRISKTLALRVWRIQRLNVYNGWACTQCRKACVMEYGSMDDVKDPFDWLYDETIIHTPSTAGPCLSQWDNNYEPAYSEASPSQQANGKREFKQWLASTGYEGRWRSTDNYRSLSQHDKTTFRSQVKAIFRHVLHQLATKDVDVV